MKSAAISELKAKIGEYLKQVLDGEEILILSHGKPVARIVPVEKACQKKLTEEERRKMTPEEWREYLVQSGIVRPPLKKASAEFWMRELPPDPGDSVLKALLEEREEGR